MPSSPRALLALLLVGALVVAGCPRPPPESLQKPSRVAPDAVAVLRLPRLERAERAAKRYLEGTRGSQRSELEAMLAFAVGGKSSGASLLGLDPRGALLVSWRPSGEALVWLPVADARRFALALDRLLEARGAARDDDVLGGVRAYRDRDGAISMLARASEGGALLWPTPRDPLGAAALLDALASGRLGERWPKGASEPHETAAAELYAEGEGVWALSPSLAALFGGPDALTGARGLLFVDEGGVRLELSLGLAAAARARVEEQTRGATQAPAGFCAIEEDAALALRLPVALLRTDADDDGPLDELQGALAVALLRRPAGPPGWVALSRPRGLAGRDALLASVAAAGVVERRQERVGARTVRLFSSPASTSSGPDAPDEQALRVIADEDLVAIAFAADDALRTVAEGGARCEETRDAAVHLVVEPRALAAALDGPSSAAEGTADAGDALGAEGALLALRRLAARLPSGLERLEATASLVEGEVKVRALGALPPPAAGESSR